MVRCGHVFVAFLASFYWAPTTVHLLQSAAAVAHPAANPAVAAINAGCARGGAIYNAISGVVNAAVNPIIAALNPIDARLQRLEMMMQNVQARHINSCARDYDSPLAPLVTAAGAPFMFPATVHHCSQLSAVDLTALELHYGMPAVGAVASLGARIQRFRLFIGLRPS